MNRSVRIAYVIPTLDMDEGGGINEFLYLLLRHLDKEKFEVRLYVFYSSLQDQEKFKNVVTKIHVAEERQENNNSLKLFTWLCKSFRSFEPDVVHTNIYWADTLGREAAIKTKVPAIIMTEHNTNLSESKSQIDIKRRLARFTDLIICNTQQVLDYSREVDEIPEEKMAIIPCAYDSGRYLSNLQPSNEFAGHFYSVGRLVDQKQPLSLIRAFVALLSQHPSWVLHLIGDGELHQDCESLIADLGVQDHVLMEGYKDDPFANVLNDSVLLLNSYYEGQGIVLLEAMAKGLICIAPDCGGVPSVIEDRLTGFLFPTSDIEALKATIEIVTSLSSEEAQMIKWRAQEEVKKEFGPETMAQRYTHAYRRVLQSKYENHTELLVKAIP